MLQPVRPELKHLETNYHFELICTDQDDARVRTLLLNEMELSPVKLGALATENVEFTYRVRITAEL